MHRPISIALFAASTLAIAACAPVTAPQTQDASPSLTAPYTTTPTPASMPSPAMSDPYTAIGTEPFWSLTIEGETATFQPMDGAATVAQNLSARPSINGWRYTSDMISIDVTFTPCSDGMSDTVYKDTVTVLLGTTEYRGCGGGAATPGAMVSGTAWQIVSVKGAEVYNPMGRGPLLVRFGRDRLSAATGCNGLGAHYLAGEGWLYAPMVTSTRRACEPRLMEQERTIGAALSGHQMLRAGAEGAIVVGPESDEITLVRAGDCPECAELDDAAPVAQTLSGDWDIRQIGRAAVTSSRPYRLNFADGQVSGFAGCNRFFGPFVMPDGVLSFGAMGTTRMRCTDGAGDDEFRILQIMRTPLAYRFTGPDAVLLGNASGGLVLQRATE